LKNTVGYFIDENMAFVQTPQVYYNKDMYQHNLNQDIPNEQDFFMRDVEEARASKRATLHVGTNAVFRRKYVEEIGGYPTSSITEDMAVGMLLQNRGYDSVFLNEELVLGLSANNFEELVKQRDRWCRGNLQAFKSFNPIFMKGLTFSQKIAYIDGVLYWLSSIQKMIFILSPIIFYLLE
jgi:Glycosyltransferases, probably involved in cell wall biogenesis